MKPGRIARCSALVLLLAAGGASAHVSIISGPAPANKTQEVVFGVGHGCEGADTSAISIDIPPEVTSVRPLSSDFGPLSVTTDDAGTVTAVSWKKLASTILPADVAYYKLVVRLKTPEQAFSTLLFPVQQTCMNAEGHETVVDWAAAEETEDAEPAPSLAIVPPHYPGWNKFSVSHGVSNLDAFFGDAQIVWRGDAAYSINPTTVELIGETEGVTRLSSLRAGDEIWVRY